MQYPDWLMKAKESKKLLQWIQDPVHSFKMFHGRLLLKCQEEDCIADRHACGESKIKSVLARSRKKLYRLLKEAGYEG